VITFKKITLKIVINQTIIINRNPPPQGKEGVLKGIR
jgi:hypothetical protein